MSCASRLQAVASVDRPAGAYTCFEISLIGTTVLHVLQQVDAASVGKKWFLQPSLAAKAGDVMAGPPVTFSTHVYRSLRVLTKLELRMETAAILVLRKVLDPENPAHQRIIDASQPPDEQEEGEGESANDTSAAASTSSPIGNALSPRGTKRRVKAERTQSNKAVKPEPNQTPRNQNSGGQADVIDLTGF